MTLRRRYGHSIKYTTHNVLAGRYRGRKGGIGDKTLLTHAVLEGAEKSLCGLRADDALCDMAVETPPDCPRCVQRLATRQKKEASK